MKKNSGGKVLLEKHGSEYFSNLRKKGWIKTKKAMKFYEEEMAKKKMTKSEARRIKTMKEGK